MKAAAPVLATLAALLTPPGAHALLGGTQALTSKPGVTATETLALAPAARNALIAKTVREGSFASRGVCAPGVARRLAGAQSGGYWRMDCADAEPHLVAMPADRTGQAIVLSCARAKSLLRIDCGQVGPRGAGR